MKEFTLLYKKLIDTKLIAFPTGLLFITMLLSISPISGSIIGFITCYFILNNSYKDIYNFLTIMPIKTKQLIGSLYCPLIYVNVGGYILGSIVGIIVTGLLPIQFFLTATIVIILQNLLIPMSFKYGFNSSPSLSFTVSLVGVGILSALLNLMIYSDAFLPQIKLYSIQLFLVGIILIILSTLYSFKKSLAKIYG